MTYEKLIKDYPIGKVLCHQESEKVTEVPFCNNNDLKIYSQQGELLFVNKGNCTCQLKSKVVVRHEVVEGYVFDGTEWHPAHDTWDGWIPYYDEEIRALEALNEKN